MKPTTIERFEAKYIPEPTSGCWIWTASLGSTGYGQFHDGERVVKAHRFSYSTYIGTIPDGMHVLHRCDQPLCVNPSHLFIGTNADNVADMVAKGRQQRADSHWSALRPETVPRGDAHYSRRHPERAQRGERIGNSKLTDAQVAEIRSIQGETQRSIAAHYGVGQSQISEIRRGKAWTHIPQPQPPEAAP